MTRMEAARRRLRVARYAIAVSAVALFGVLGAAVRTSHPARHTSSQPAPDTTSEAASDDSFFSSDDEDDGDGFSVGPAGSAQPTIQSGGS